ncbi:GNAT family N-acetyltransferase [Streptomyces beihaiensis]|uniref:GNAT family N-acetyltransferase n=1 Tax=Streptomyces beihaiensis TaxID=2984495 RepID=A0ABT3TW82_9ACTN|nr:GNAT family N-acetyltransferase [Streptomyces beihaiensis]MCX3061274.1 GNAT family N-acetyltransferase [Streptomyces beihaiensis]
MPMTFQLDPPIDPALRDDVLALWADVTNAGGAVGFVPPTTPEEIRPEFLRHLTAVAEGRTRLLVGRDADADAGAGAAGTVTATAFLTYSQHRLMRHHLWVYTVMVHPKHQGRGYGRALMAAVADAARSFDGIEAVRLTCRGGTGADRFYKACGYQEVGRVPGAIRVAPGDDRDDVHLMLPLTAPGR